jgi:hypothetical protein
MEEENMSYLNFVEQGFSDSGKTKIWSVQTTAGVDLMRVSWYAPWRRYTVDTGGCKTICDSSCLREIANFLDTVNAEHKKGLTKG